MAQADAEADRHVDAPWQGRQESVSNHKLRHYDWHTFPASFKKNHGSETP
jgi:hypothetical protein